MLGWDITDYGLDDFEHIGAVLYTVRNGSIDDKSVGVPFCEKYIVMRERPAPHQPLPRGQDRGHHQPRRRHAAPLPVEGGPRHGQDDSTTDVDVYMDGVLHTFKPGAEVLVEPGNSISLTPYIAHIFGAKPGSDLVVGEVSSINDDNTDNYFLEEEPALHHHRGRRAHGLPALQRIREYILSREPSARPDRHMAGARFLRLCRHAKSRPKGRLCMRSRLGPPTPDPPPC